MMIYWLLERVFHRGFSSQKGILGLGQMDQLARSGTAAWALAQEKARLEYLAAKENYEKRPTWDSFSLTMERLLQLQSTNAIIQSLINEYLLDQMMIRAKDSAAEEPPAARRCA
jgi:hypothetical protein